MGVWAPAAVDGGSPHPLLGQDEGSSARGRIWPPMLSLTWSPSSPPASPGPTGGALSKSRAGGGELSACRPGLCSQPSACWGGVSAPNPSPTPTPTPSAHAGAGKSELRRVPGVLGGFPFSGPPLQLGPPLPVPLAGFPRRRSAASPRVLPSPPPAAPGGGGRAGGAGSCVSPLWAAGPPFQPPPRPPQHAAGSQNPFFFFPPSIPPSS